MKKRLQLNSLVFFILTLGYMYPSFATAQDLGMYNPKLSTYKPLDNGIVLMTFTIYERNGESSNGDYTTKFKIQLNKLGLHGTSTQFIIGKKLKKYFRIKYNSNNNIVTFTQKNPMKADSSIDVTMVLDVNTHDPDQSENTENHYRDLNGFAAYKISNIFGETGIMSSYANRTYDINQCE